MLARRLSELVSQTLKSQPSMAQVHTPAPEPLSDEEKRKRRRQLVAGAVKKSAGIAPDAAPGIYVGRQLLNADQLQAWWAKVRRPGEPDLDPHPHVTVAYSAAPFEFVHDVGHLVILPSQFWGWKLLGADNAVVLCLMSAALESRWNDTLKAGASWDHSAYQPHLTLFYLGAGYDSTQWRDGQAPPVPDFPLVFGPELVGPIGQDVFLVATAPDWYVPGGRVAKSPDDRVHVTVHVAPAAAPNVQVVLPAPQLVRKVGELTRGADGKARMEITEGPPDAFPADADAVPAAAAPADAPPAPAVPPIDSTTPAAEPPPPQEG